MGGHLLANFNYSFIPIFMSPLLYNVLVIDYIAGFDWLLQPLLFFCFCFFFFGGGGGGGRVGKTKNFIFKFFFIYLLSFPYKLREKVEIPIELQVEDDSAFLHEVSPSQYRVSQVQKSGLILTLLKISIDLDIGGCDDPVSDYSEQDSLMVNRRRHFVNSESENGGFTRSSTDQ